MSEPTVPPPPSYNPPPPPPPSSGGPVGTGHVSPNRTIMIVLSYLGPLAFIPLLVEKDDHEVQWHARNGILFLLAWVVLGFALTLVSFVDFTGCSGCILSWVLIVVAFVVHILAILKGINGQRLIIPGLSQYADRPWF